MKYFCGLEFLGFVLAFSVVCILKFFGIIGMTWFFIVGTIIAIPIIIMLVFLIEALYILIKDRKSLFNFDNDDF